MADSENRSRRPVDNRSSAPSPSGSPISVTETTPSPQYGDRAGTARPTPRRQWTPSPGGERREFVVDDDDVLLNAQQTRARVGNVSAMCIWRWIRDDRVKFPPPTKINRRNYWRLGDLRRWQAQREAASRLDT